MKVSLNWIKQFTDIQPSASELVEKIGSQLGAVEEVINLGERYQGIIVAKVISCEKHPDADKLSICWIDDGGKAQNIERNEQGMVHVVCGAPNVTAGLTVAWLPPGTTVPSTFDKDPFVLEAREIRGQMSNGMLASAKELAIGDSHEGILIIDKEATPGDDFAELYGLNDYIIDIENKMFTHRPDCFGMLGVAREIAGICGVQFRSPAMYREPKTTGEITENNLPLEVFNDANQFVPRFMVRVFENIEVKPSPVEIQSYLSRCGVKPINNIVDITNYFMVLSGQPMHAYDYDKVVAAGGASIGTRLSRAGEELPLLNGKTLKMDDGAVLIVSGDRPIGLGGVMGGSTTEVDNNTQNIILEGATFDMNQTRKTAMRYGLFTDAVTRYSKGQSPLQNDRVMAWACNELMHLGAIPGGTIYDLADNLTMPPPVETTAGFINSRLGLDLSADDMAHLLRNVELGVDTDGDLLRVAPPFWRTDLEIPEDIVEEVGRLYGYDHLPLVLPLRSANASEINHEIAFKNRLRQILTAAGANEILSYSFVNERLLRNAGHEAAESFHIKNALSPALQYYRQSLTPSLLDKIHPNVKFGFDKFALFEIGKGHKKGAQEDTEALPREFKLLSLVFADATKAQGGAAYYSARSYLDYLASQLHIELEYKLVGQELDIHFAKVYQPARSALVSVRGGHMLGIVGEFKQSVIQSFKLPPKCAGFEISLSDLLAAELPLEYNPLNKYPETQQDICLRVGDATSYSQLNELIGQALESTSAEAGYNTAREVLDIFQREDDKEHKQITWRIRLSHPERTLTTQEVNQVFAKIEQAAKDKFNSERI